MVLKFDGLDGFRLEESSAVRTASAIVAGSYVEPLTRDRYYTQRPIQILRYRRMADQLAIRRTARTFPGT